MGFLFLGLCPRSALGGVSEEHMALPGEASLSISVPSHPFRVSQ